MELRTKKKCVSVCRGGGGYMLQYNENQNILALKM